jgi:hypothetical protein
MKYIGWPQPEHTRVEVTVACHGLDATFPATVDLGPVEIFRDGWQPMLDAATMNHLLATLSALGDETTQLTCLGWTLRRAGADRIDLVEGELPAEELDLVDGRYRLPRECGFDVVCALPPLAQVYRSLSLLHAYTDGPTDQPIEADELLAEAHTAARALGDILGAIISLAVDPDPATIQAISTRLHTSRDGEPDRDEDELRHMTSLIGMLVASAVDTATAGSSQPLADPDTTVTVLKGHTP